MDAPIDVLRRAVRTERFDEDGESLVLELLPPATQEQLNELGARLPCALPPHIRELLGFCRGFEGSAADLVDFLGELSYEQAEIFPNGLPIVLQSSSLISFLIDLLLGSEREDNAVAFVHEEATSAIWKDDPVGVSRQDALWSSDAAIRAFAQQVPEGFVIADLRNVDVGSGFCWGRFGCDTRIVRSGVEPIFAYGAAK